MTKLFYSLIILFAIVGCQSEVELRLSSHQNGQPHEVLVLDSPVTLDSVGTKYIYRADGTLKCSGGYRKGLKHGPWTCFYPDSTVEWQGSFIYGKENGTIHCRYQDSTWREYEMRNGLLDGQAVEFNKTEDGVFWYVHGQYVNGLENGTWIHSDVDGKRILLETYVNGGLQGKMVTYHANGYVHTEGNCVGKDSMGSVIMTDTLFFYNARLEGQLDSFKVLK